MSDESMYLARFSWNSISSAKAVSSSARTSSVIWADSVRTGLNPGERIGSRTARRSPLVGRRILDNDTRKFGGCLRNCAQLDWFIFPLSLCLGRGVSSVRDWIPSQVRISFMVVRGSVAIEDRGTTRTLSPSASTQRIVSSFIRGNLRKL